MNVIPNFFIIGAQKAGTTNLYHLLRQHPDVFIPGMKEPGYFHWVGSSNKVRWPNGAVTRVGVQDWDEYLSLYKDAGGRKAVGDASTLYLGNPDAARRIRETVPDAKIVVVLRNPVDRAYSAYNYMRRNGKEPVESFEDAIALEGERMAGGFAPALHYLSRGFYAKQLRAWYELFPRDQIKVCLFEEVITEPLRTCAELFEFLGVDSRFIPDLEASGGIQRNVSGIPNGRFSAKMRAWVWGSTPFTAFLKPMIPPAVRRRLRWGIWRLQGSKGLKKPETLSPACREKLCAVYREDIQDLELLLGRSLVGWA